MTAIRALLALFVLSAGCAMPSTGSGSPATDAAPRWWKGNTHTHTLWSDGDGAPDLVADWYVRHGYDFLVLSDHNVMLVGETWFTVKDGGRLTPARLAGLREQFGDDWVETREVDGVTEMRLKTLEELRARYESPGEFMFIQGEEITDSYRGIPVHVNGVHLAGLIEPQGGKSVVDTMQRNVDAVTMHGHEHMRTTLAHVNHPNFGWAISVTDLATLRGEPLFEVFNGHPSVNNRGNDEHPGAEAMWDRAMTLRLTLLELGVLYGVASDDAHQYHAEGQDFANAGRGWVMVRAETLAPELILDAMHRGDFYASTGVVLEEVRYEDNRYTVVVDESMAADCTVQFIGTRRTGGEIGPIGEVLLATTANPAVYELTGDELYVRAKIVSTRPPANPLANDASQAAWTQPVRPRPERPRARPKPR